MGDGEPNNNAGGGQDCGQLYSNAIDDVSCDEVKPYVCEFEAESFAFTIRSNGIQGTVMHPRRANSHALNISTLRCRISRVLMAVSASAERASLTRLSTVRAMDVPVSI